VTTTAYVSKPPETVEADLLVLPVFKGPEPGPGVAEAGLAEAFAQARLTGKRGETLLVTGGGFAADAVLLVGVGPKAEFSLEGARRALGKVAQGAGRFGTVATTFPMAFGPRRSAEAVGAALEGLGLGAYRFDRYKTAGDEPPKRIDAVVAVGSPTWDTKAMKAAARRAEVVVASVCWARDLVNTPAGDLPPAGIADAAVAMAEETGLEVTVWGEQELKKAGMGGILGVGKGSVNPPRLIELAYRGGGKGAPLALSGKGISFDSGGLSLKDGKGMETMKCDMGGAASILATMRAIALLKPKIDVIAAIPSSENMPSGSAQRPGDVITHYGGTTSEVLNTDAEGRLVLADSLALLAERKPAAIVDTATLTGAAMIALGTDITAAFANDDALAKQLLAAADATGEPMWRMPLHRDYRALIDSNVADIKNIGERWGGAITAAWFLAEFVGETPWVHLDIAGPAFMEKPYDLGPKGGTGVPVRTLVRWVLDRADAAAAERAKARKPRAAKG
jgi:leucyl aminopeptidase